MDTTKTTNVVVKLNNLAVALAELEGTTKAEIASVIGTMYVPNLPTSRGIKGAAPLDTQLADLAIDAEWTARECDEAVGNYDRLSKRAAAVLHSPVLKSLAVMAEAGKARAKERRDECEKMAAEARTELARRQKAREEAMAELEKAQQAANEVERIKQELASLRATFA